MVVGQDCVLCRAKISAHWRRKADFLLGEAIEIEQKGQPPPPLEKTNCLVVGVFLRSRSVVLALSIDLPFLSDLSVHDFIDILFYKIPVICF